MPGPSEHRKRQRSLSSGSDGALTDGGSDVELGPLAQRRGSDRGGSGDSPALKYHRAPSPPRELLCTLPPSCAQPDTVQRFATQAELDAHQEAFHRWVCRVPVRDKPGRVGEGAHVAVPAAVMPEHFSGRNPGGRGKSTRWRECGKVFPDGRLLELHECETHDPLARERIERGESIFACFLPPEQCSKTFFSPKKRRWHLINDHGYPKEYFFAITNHGLNQLTRTDGLAASLIRPRRDLPADSTSASPLHRLRQHPHVPGTPEGLPGAPAHAHSHTHAPGPARRAPARPPPSAGSAGADGDGDVDMDALTAKLAESSLSFVPRNVARRTRQRETRV